MSSAARTLELSTEQRRLLESLCAVGVGVGVDVDVDGAVDSVDAVGAVDAVEASLAQPPIRLSAEVLSTKRVAAGAGVSYGHTFHTPTATTLALVSIGYGHGIPRKAGNRAQVTWWDSSASQSVRFPIVGRVAMDVLVIDVGDSPLRSGESVVLFGDPRVGEIDLHEWAMTVGENPVTIVGALNSRVTRLERE
jgi:alanine racemase